MIKTNPDGTPVLGQKVVDSGGRVMTVITYTDKPSIGMEDDQGRRTGCCVGSLIYNGLIPFEETAPKRCAPPDALWAYPWHWLSNMHLAGRAEPWGWHDGTWDRGGSLISPQKMAEFGWTYMHVAEPNQGQALRTTRHAIGDISVEETTYNDWTDEELSAAWRKVCNDTAGDLPPSKNMLVFARRVLNGEKAS